MNIITIPHTVVRAYDCHQNLLMGCHSVVPDMTDVHCTCVLNEGHVATSTVYRARQLYKNISMLFLFPVKDGKHSTGVNATFDASCYG